MTTLTSKVELSSISIVLKLPRLLGFRNWLSVQIIRLLGWVTPFTVEVAHD